MPETANDTFGRMFVSGKIKIVLRQANYQETSGMTYSQNHTLLSI